MENWADELIAQYRKHQNELRRQVRRLDPDDLADQQIISSKNSMTRDMEFVLGWLETGRQPGNYRGADKRGVYQKSYGNLDFIPDIVEQLEDGPKLLYMTAEEKMIMQDIFKSLSHREKHCYILHVAKGISMGEIAKGLCVSKATVQTHIERAKKKVKDRVKL
ncbi:sigma-70 family RNA polymerase sigma factor [Indiicoccus explosivorum]|uniref:sigma-70 family RNA polymerase sigma factor n=1 Tax=Indiicoccus explosivorum TaxID=1917864 RepID=UPI000B454C88|nr:sigma-70 family RNA polymerase sigma factor [Indiicoccus explosivorum]